jgi:two-component sensor histidine kinase
MIGINMDVTERKAAQERRALLAYEVDHRAKNALAVVESLLRLTPRDDPEAFAQAVGGRVRALARAHELLAEEGWDGVRIGALATAVLRAALSEEAPELPPRLRIEGPELRLAPVAVHALAMALHELATNARRHGALAAPAGEVDISWGSVGADGTLHLVWRERGGPRQEASPRAGFGWRVLDATVQAQLDGHVARRWQDQEFSCDIVVPLRRALASTEAPTLWQPQRRG